MIDFRGDSTGGVTLNSGMISVKELRVAVQELTTPAQWEQIERAIDYGQLNGIKVIVTPVR